MPSRPLALSDLFPRDRIVVDVSSADKESLFSELVELLGSTSPGPFDRSAALACVMEREALMSTGIRPGIAVPHGKTESVAAMMGAIGVSKRGVDYDAFDGGPVKLAFLILSPRHGADLHLKTLKLLAEALDLPGFTEALMSASDPAAAHEVIRRFEELLGSA